MAWPRLACSGFALVSLLLLIAAPSHAGAAPETPVATKGRASSTPASGALHVPTAAGRAGGSATAGKVTAAAALSTQRATKAAAPRAAGAAAGAAAAPTFATATKTPARAAVDSARNARAERVASGASAKAMSMADALARAKALVYVKQAYDRRPAAGMAKGEKAGGRPDPVPGLANPDVPAVGPKSATMEDLVLPWGYPLETYPVETSDGFVLRLYRIPFGVKNATERSPDKPAVLLLHGVTLASSSFVALDPESSVAFYLADAGFDVWMANMRGNTYSRGNRYYVNTDRAYWEFSVDEQALIELPAQMDFVLKFTGHPSLGIVGHSQGCTLPLMLLAQRPEYNAKVWLMLLLGPVANAEYLEAAFMRYQGVTGSAQELLAGMGAGGFIPNSVTSMETSGCDKSLAQALWCQRMIHFMFYGQTKLISPWDLMKIGATWPSTVSVRNLVHWGQMINAASGLRMFDFGTNCSTVARVDSRPFEETCNQAKYGQDDPPTYDLSHVTAKAAIMEGEYDKMATPGDVNKLIQSWGADLVYRRSYPDFSHMDFVWSREPLPRQDIIDVLWHYAPR